MKVLLAEDSPVYKRMLTNLLTDWGYEVTAVTNGDDAASELRSLSAPQMAILDWSMPGSSGIKVCREVRSAGAKHYTYILLLTAHRDKEHLIEAFEAGVDDYLTKPFNDLELEARLRAGRRIVGLQDNLISISDTLRHQACHDGLTGIWNRRAILEFLERQLARAEREGNSPVSLILADVDHFKQVNDSYGHLAGDAVLRETAQTIRKSIRSYDGVGRYGGEEFVIVLPGCRLPDAVVRAEEIQRTLSNQNIAGAAAPFSISVSMGVACAGGMPAMEQLLRQADIALYQAKKKGRNRVEVAYDLSTDASNRSEEHSSSCQVGPL